MLSRRPSLPSGARRATVSRGLSISSPGLMIPSRSRRGTPIPHGSQYGRFLIRLGRAFFDGSKFASTTSRPSSRPKAMSSYGRVRPIFPRCAFRCLWQHPERMLPTESPAFRGNSDVEHEFRSQSGCSCPHSNEQVAATPAGDPESCNCRSVGCDHGLRFGRGTRARGR